MLLMVEAHVGEIICPNKQTSGPAHFHEGHLLETETYIGGHVECLESGVFRADLPCKFKLVPAAFDGLIRNIDRALTFSIEVEAGVQRSDVINYDQVRTEIIEKLEMLRDSPVSLVPRRTASHVTLDCAQIREEPPLIYHLDVAAMYPNIILSNRLQPCAIVDSTTCAACDFNDPSSRCKRNMEWEWRGEYFPATRAEYQAIKTQLEYEPVRIRGARLACNS